LATKVEEGTYLKIYQGMGGWTALVPVVFFLLMSRIIGFRQDLVFKDWANVS